MQKIQPEVVVRGKSGYWTHSKVPDWGEFAPPDVLAQWQLEHGIDIDFVWMEEDGDLEFVERWFDEGLYDVTPWTPTPPSDDHFLLSICETEDGPISWWAVPRKEKPRI